MMAIKVITYITKRKNPSKMRIVERRDGYVMYIIFPIEYYLKNHSH